MNIHLIFRPVIATFVFLSLLTGVIYPILVTGLGKVLFPVEVSGSIIQSQGISVGSKLIGQNWTKDIYFWGRPSATSPEPYFPGSSSGSNLAPTNPLLTDRISADIERYSDHSGNPIPADLITSSASGLDPHISLDSALFQVKRVAAARGLKEDGVKQLIFSLSEGGFPEKFSPKRINLLKLNMTLDERDRSK